MLHGRFIELCHAVELKWTQKRGAVALLYSSHNLSLELRLCAGPVLNTGVMAENCRLWNMSTGELLYEGELKSTDLQKVLTSHRVCRAEITDSENVGKNKGRRMCLGAGGDCGLIGCPARSGNAKRAAVQGA